MSKFTPGPWVVLPLYGKYYGPLTDPGADAFMERIKRLAREPINEVSKETVK